MPMFQARAAGPDDFPAILESLPSAQYGCPPAKALAYWKRWHEQGALSVGVIEAIDGTRRRTIAGAGVTLWVSDEAVEGLEASRDEACSVALYRAGEEGGWPLKGRQIEAAHAQCRLNLWIVHFWPDPDPSNPSFAAFFEQSDKLFREQHDGFGVGQLLQEVTQEHVPLMQSAGMRIKRPAVSAASRVLVSLTRDDARARPGSHMSFLFLKPPATLQLKPAEKRMLTFALQELTDADIAERMQCSREYVRKLWSRVYDTLHAKAALVHEPVQKSDASHRGREKRRRALEFFRAHREELRPGLPPT